MAGMSTRADELLSRLEALTQPVTVVAIGAYPRVGHTGHLEEVGAGLERVEAQLGAADEDAFRVMHAMAVVLMQGDDDPLEVVRRTCQMACTNQVEIRALVVRVSGARDAEWLDRLFGDLSLRRRFGSFTEDPTSRIVDGNVME